MFSPFERMVAVRYLRARRREGFISIIAWFSLLGIALGVATLIIVMSVMNGFRAEFMAQILGINGHVAVYGAPGQGIEEFEPLAAKIRTLPGVISATPIIENFVYATAPTGAGAPAEVRGIMPQDLGSMPAVVKSVQFGNVQDFGDNDGVMIGDRLAQKLGLQIGDLITLISPGGNATAFGTIPRSRAYHVIATFDVGMYQVDSAMIFMPLPAAQLYFRLPERATDIQVMLTDPDQIGPTLRVLRQIVPTGLRLYDWQKNQAALLNAVTTERNVMFMILTMIIVVAAFNVISSLIMLVKDKTRDIAILRTMGATRGMILRIFFLSGAAVGVIGTAAGLALGLAFSLNIEAIRQLLQRLTGTELFSAEIYFLSRLPAKVDSGEVILVTAIAIGLSFLATIYPSWRAAKLDPVEALRYE